MKYSPKVAASAFIKKHFPNACVAFLGGSAAHRNLTPNSDLDIVVFDDTQFPSNKTTPGMAGPLKPL
jgi:predicted nucleotidyltransferase